uniref:Putative YciI-like protein n=1 Tax=Cryptococcus depauperatus TaxID=5208 RepID=D2JWU5_9TREE|nr:putative YciI-like protein [Cryptococcus depauperatus]
MPRFLVYAPDCPDYLERRLAVRAEHLARAKLDDDAGIVYVSLLDTE